MIDLPDPREWLFTDRERRPKGCRRCLDERDERVRMERGERFDPRRGRVVGTWVCPECDREVVRASADPPGDPTRQRVDPEHVDVETRRAPSRWWE